MHRLRRLSPGCRSSGEDLGVAFIGRGFQVSLGVPFRKPIAEALRKSGPSPSEASPAPPAARAELSHQSIQVFAGRSITSWPEATKAKRLPPQRTVKPRWLGEGPAIGYETRISQEVDLGSSEHPPRVRDLKSKLVECGL
jgi:hypothetical protein